MFNFEKSLKKAKDIVEGHVNELFNINEELGEQRMKICKDCPLYIETSVGPKCNAGLFLNPITEISYTTEMPNTVQGCGCRLSAKVTIEEQQCPAGKW